MLVREVGRPRVLLTTALTIALFGFLPTWVLYGDRGAYQLAFPSELYTMLLRRNLLVLVFPLVAALPCAIHFGAEIHNRFVTYARMRVSIRKLLSAKLAANAFVAFVAFFFVALIPQFFVAWGTTSYYPEGSGLATPEAMLEEELSRPVDWVFRRRSVGCSIGRVVRLVCRF